MTAFGAGPFAASRAPRYVVALIAALAAILLSTTASASATVGAETRVGAFNVAGEALVGPPEHIAAGQRLGNGVAGPDIVVATGVAAKTESGAVGRLLRDERGSIRIPGGGLSPNQMNKAIQRGQAPPGLRRVDTGKVTGEQTHIHFEDGSALNMDGTWKHGVTDITNRQGSWLEDNGWVVPRG